MMLKPLHRYFFSLLFILSLPSAAQNVRFLTGLPVLKAGGSTDRSLVFQAQTVGGQIFFVAGDGGQNYELWITDGRPEGTVKLKDLNGNDAALPYGFTVLNNRLIFAATDGGTGTELWISDGTRRGTQLLKDIWPGTIGSEPRRLTLLNNRVVFFAGSDQGVELWSTDGTAEGTQLVKDMNPDASTYEFEASAFGEKPLPVVDGQVYFAGRTNGIPAGNDPALFVSNGTTGGTRVLINNVTSAALTPVKLGGAIYFLANSDGSPSALWKSDLTTFATTELAAITSFKEPTVLGDKVFFVNGTALWETDGTAGGTKKTAALTHTNPNTLTVFNNKLYLYGTGVSNNKSLLRFDGAASVQALSATLNTGAEYAPVVVKNKLYAPLQTTATQHVMLATDGATQNFAFAATAPSATIPYATKNLFAFNDELYFTGTTTQRGTELWKIGPTGGTVLVEDANPGTVSSDPQLIGIAGTQRFLFAATSPDGREFWISQGVAGNTQPVGNLNPGATYANPVLDNSAPIFMTDSLLVQADSLAFWVYDIHEQTSEFLFQHPDYKKTNIAFEQAQSLGGSGAMIQIANGNVDELWVTNGIDPVWKLLENSNVVEIGQFSGAPLFAATVANGCTKLYIHQGTQADAPVALIPTGDKTSCLQTGFRPYRNKVYFASQNGTNGKHTLWETNGTLAGTKMFLDVAGGDPSISLQMLWEFNGELYFIVKSSGQSDLWKTDGTIAGSDYLLTLSTSNFPLVTSTTSTALGTDAYFTFYDLDANASSLVATNGTPAGTRIIRQFRSTGPYLVAANNRVFFTATTDENGKELWYTQGTLPTTAVLDIIEGDSSSLVDSNLEGPDLGVLDDKVYFRVYDRYATALNGELPTRLWVTDGTMPNTHAVVTPNGEEKITNPNTFFPYLFELYFAGGGSQNYGLWQITEGTGSLEVRFEGKTVLRNRPAEWGYAPTNDPQSGTLVIKNTSAYLLTLESITGNNDEFQFEPELPLPATIAAGEEFSISVMFESAEKAKRSVNIALTTDIVNDPAFVFSIEIMTTETSLVTIKPAKSSLTYCPDEEAVFTADPIVNGGLHPSFAWKHDGETVGITTVPEFAFTGLEHGDDVSVVLFPSEDALATNASATSADVGVTVLTPSTTTVQIHADHNGSAAPGSVVVFTAQTTNAGLNPVYQWYMDEEPLAGQTSAALTFTVPDDLEGSITIKLLVTPDAPCPAAPNVFSNNIELDIVTGIADPADLQLSMYPNPARDKFHIINGAGKPVNATVIDTRGSSMGKYEGREIVVETTTLPAGIYLVRVQAGKSSVVRKIVVVK
jgi:ELWxxDGT repeat protein